MQLSQSNYLQHREQIEWSRMPAGLTDKPKTVTDNAAAKGWADMGEQTQKATEQFFKLCNLLIAKDGSLVDGNSSAAKPPASKPKRIRAPKAEKAAAPAGSKLIIDLPRNIPQAKEVPMIATPNAFIKRYVGMHGKIKPREGRGSILELVHGLQKAITEGRISQSHHCSAEIGKMQSSLINLFYNMDERGKIEIDAPSLAHYKEIAQGEEVRTSVKLLKQFIQINGKAPDKVKAEKLGKRIAIAYDTIPKEDPYRSELAAAAKSVAAFVSGETKAVGIPAATLHGLGGIAAGGVNGLGFVAGSGEGAIIRLLRQEGVKNLSDATLKKAFRRTVAPGLCLEIAKSLIRRGELTMEVLNNPDVKKKFIGLDGVNGEASTSGRITDLDILELRLQNAARSNSTVAGLGNAGTNMVPQTKSRREATSKPVAKQSEGQIMSTEALKTMKFETIGLTGKWKALIGDPAPGFSAMVYGLPKQGKSTFCLQLANDLAKHGQVLYCALEEGFGSTLSEKLHRLGIASNSLQFANQIPQDLSSYKFVFIDSVSEVGLDAEGLRELRKANPGVAFIFVYHSTKSGNFRGSNTDAHDVDIIVEVKNGTASARGRYAPPSEMAI